MAASENFQVGYRLFTQADPVYTEDQERVPFEENDENKEKFLFDSAKDAKNFKEYLELNLPEGCTVSVEGVENEAGDPVGYEVSIESENGEKIELSQNEDNEFVLQTENGEVVIPKEDLEKMSAVGRDEVNEMIGSDNRDSNGDKLKAGKEWGKLASEFKDDLNLTGDWKPGQPIKFEGDSYKTIQETLEFSDFNADQDTIDKAIVEYAASEGFLDDGVIEEYEASEIASYIKSDEFEEKMNSSEVEEEDDITEVMDQFGRHGTEMDEDTVIDLLPKYAEGWGGDVNKEDLEDIASDKSRSKEERNLAKTLLKNEDLFDRIDKSFNGEADGSFSPTDVKKFAFEARKDLMMEKLPEFVENWGGEDGLVGREDLENIANDESKSKEERNVAKFLLENEEIYNKIESTFDGKEDGYFSPTDVKKFVFDTGHEQMLAKLPGFMEDWGGEDGIVGKEDLEKIVNDPARSKEEKQVAKFLLDNEDVFDKLQRCDGKNDGYFDARNIDQYKKLLEFDEGITNTSNNHEIDTSNMTGTKKKYYENRDTFKTIFANWDNWNGKDAIVSKKDLEKIANSDAPEAEKKAAQFLLDNPDIFDAMDSGRDGGSGDGKISTMDLERWIEKNDIFGGEFLAANSSYLKTISQYWEQWNGSDTIVSQKDLEKIANDSNATQEERDAAKFMLDNPDFMFFLDIKGQQGSSDGKIGKDFFDLHDGIISNNFNQASEGNCWALTGFYSLAQTDEGTAAIQKSIRQGENGNFYVTFAGDPNHKEYEITAEELKNTGFTQGGSDRDMKIMNIALDKFVKDNPDFDGLPSEGIGSGGWMDALYRLVTGEGESLDNPKENGIDWLVENADKINNGEMTVSAATEVNGDGNMQPDTGSYHAFTIVGVDPESKTIKYVNPWNGGEVKEISFDEFQKMTESKIPAQINYRDFS